MSTIASEITLPRMPEFWQTANLIVSHKALSGALAHWAVAQSPYTVPDNLGTAVEQFMQAWDAEDYWQTNSDDLYAKVLATIERCPLIQVWNHPKDGKYELVFVSRYDRPAPDCDFIDLYALARNVCHDVVAWEQLHRAHD